jgi:hypothetical protein
LRISESARKPEAWLDVTSVSGASSELHSKKVISWLNSKGEDAFAHLGRVITELPEPFPQTMIIEAVSSEGNSVNIAMIYSGEYAMIQSIFVE